MRVLINKHRKTLAQMAQYFMVAAVGLGIDFSTVIFLTEMFDLFYLIGICAGFLLGLVVTYVLSNRFVFGVPRGNHRRAFVLFGIIGLVGLGILNLLVWGLTGGLGINYIISKALATIVVFMWNFFARKKLFQEKQDYLEA